MTVYMVFEPPEAGGDPVTRAERFVFIRDRFSWSAFLFAPLWMLARRLWLVFLAYVVVVGALMVALWYAGAGAGAGSLIVALIGMLIGFEAANLRRWTLLRRGWRERGTVIGDDLEAAERRFFDAFVAGEAERNAERKNAPTPSPSPPPPFRAGPVAADVIGLFPQPGAKW